MGPYNSSKGRERVSWLLAHCSLFTSVKAAPGTPISQEDGVLVYYVEIVEIKHKD